jgi:hypothetical protein
MLRRCLQSGGRSFGMCLPRQERAPGEGHFQDVGTLLRIESCKFSPDGRCAPRLPPPSGMARAPLRAAERAPLTPLNPKPSAA